MGKSQPAFFLQSKSYGGMNMKKFGKTLKRFWPLYLMFVPGVVYLLSTVIFPCLVFRLLSGNTMPETVFMEVRGAGYKILNFCSAQTTLL